MHDFLKKPKRHHVKEIPLAPILDLLVVVIFFLILSATFIEMRQNTIPPSSTVVAKNSDAKEDLAPLNPKLIMALEKNEITLMLSWRGASPGILTKKLKAKDISYDRDLKSSTLNILTEFKKKYPDETKLQIGWQGNIKYQSVLTVVDGAMLGMKDLVLISPEESETLFQKSL
jgi:biopolymer transport protein ExbD